MNDDAKLDARMPNSMLSHTSIWRKRQVGVISSEKAPFVMRTYMSLAIGSEPGPGRCSGVAQFQWQGLVQVRALACQVIRAISARDGAALGQIDPKVDLVLSWSRQLFDRATVFPRR